MGYVTTPDGRTMFVPDAFGGSPTFGAPPPSPPSDLAPNVTPPPIDASASSQPPPDASTPLPVPPSPPGSVTTGVGPASADLSQPTPGAPQVSAPPPTPVSGKEFAVAPPSPSPPQPPTRAQQQFAQRQAAYAASPDGKMAAADIAQQDADAAGMQAIAAQQGADIAKAGDVQTAQDAAARRLAQIQADNQAWQKQYDQTRADKQAYVDQTLKDVDNFKIDQNRAYSNLGTGRQIGVWIAAALAGIGDAMAGRNQPNPVISMMQQAKEQDIRLQMDQRDQLKERNARAEHALDRFDAFSKDKQAQFELLSAQSDKLLAQQLAQAAAKSAIPEAQARAKAGVAQLLQSSADHAQKAAEFAANNDLQKKQLAVSQAGNAIAAGHLALAQRADARADRVQQWQEYKDQQELDLKAATEAAKVSGKLDANTSKLAVSAPVIGSDGASQLLTNKDGTPWLDRSPEAAEKTSGLVASAASYNRLSADLIRLIREHGGEADFIKSKAWQEAKSKLAEATAELHDNYDIKRFGEQSVEFFDKIATANIDPTSFLHDATAALQSSNADLQARVNDHLAAKNYTGKPVRFTDLSQAQEPALSPEEKDLSGLLQRKGPDERGSELLRNPDTLARMSKMGGSSVGWAQRAASELGDAPLPREAALMDQYAAAMRSSDQAIASKASAFLAQIASESRDKTNRQYARQLLATNSVQFPDDETTTGPAVSRGSTARETIPLYPAAPNPDVSSLANSIGGAARGSVIQGARR